MKNPVSDPRIIVALDVSARAEAEHLVESLGDSVSFYKIGLQLLATDGLAMARDLKARGRSVFADWKLHDIGATVEKASAALAASGSCDLLTVHAEPQVLSAAVRGRGDAPMKILGVTVLTSLNGQDLGEIGYTIGVETLVERRVRQALDAGADGSSRARTKLRSRDASAVQIFSLLLRAYVWQMRRKTIKRAPPRHVMQSKTAPVTSSSADP